MPQHAVDQLEHGFEIRIVPPPARAPKNLLANAEIIWRNGILSGIKLTGFAIWRGTDGCAKVTVPSSAYIRNGKRSRFKLLRAVDGEDESRVQQICDLMLNAYSDYRAAHARAAAARNAQRPKCGPYTRSEYLALP